MTTDFILSVICWLTVILITLMVIGFIIFEGIVIAQAIQDLKERKPHK